MADKATPWILVVDPDPRTGVMVSDLFGSTAYRIEAAPSGDAAFALVERVGLPVAMITETTLPDMDGFTLVRRLQRQSEAPLAVVVLTEAPSARSASRALRQGFDDYLIKASDSVQDLRAAVLRAIRRRGERRELEHVFADLTQLNEAFMRSMKELNRANVELERRLADLPAPGEVPWRVMVVDDDVTIVALLETLLRSQGHEVLGATSGAAARRAFLSQRFDLVLTDKNLGDANGVELIGEIHQMHPDTRVLLMTGYATVEAAVDAIDSGVAAILQKPFKDLGLVVQRVDDELAELAEERAQQRYFLDIRDRHVDFEARYRLIRNKLSALQSDGP